MRNDIDDGSIIDDCFFPTHCCQMVNVVNWWWPWASTNGSQRC